MQTMNQSNYKQKEISQILLKPNFKAFSQSEDGFQRCGFFTTPSPAAPRDFIPPKCPGLIGLMLKLIYFSNPSSMKFILF